MDGLDVYIDDYGKFEPLPAAMVAELRHARELFNPTRTVVNADGHAVVDHVAPAGAAPTAEGVAAGSLRAAGVPVASEATPAGGPAAARAPLGERDPASSALGVPPSPPPGDAAAVVAERQPKHPAGAESEEPGDSRSL
jgi:hypothetical protein